MDLSNLQRLLTGEGQAALAGAAELQPAEETFLTALTRLQKQFDPALAKAALETVILRRKARVKFSRASAMYFSRDGLEMASGEIISRYRARRYAAFDTVADLGCGLGGDTLGLAGASRVTAVDLVPLHLALARANLAAYDLSATLIECDLTREPLPPAAAYFFDPGRRAAGRRIHSVRDYQPPLALINAWLPQTLGVKISPGVRLAEVSAFDCELEFISLDGELKECVLWFGPLKTAGRRATLLSGAGSSVSLTAPSGASAPPAARLSLPQAYLYEPDPAILRAGLVGALAGQLGAAQLDPDIAYLTSAALTPTPFARAFALEAALPFSQKRLRDKLRAMNVGRVTVKKRGSPLDPDLFARALRLSGDRQDSERIVFLTHVQGRPWALVGSRVESGPAG